MNTTPSPPISTGSDYEALLLVSFGGPEGRHDVQPFLENVARGKDVPPGRLAEVARRYELFDGVSPLNAQNRALLAALAGEFNAHGLRLPIYWGNRHWHPLLTDAVGHMAEDGVRRAVALVTSAFGSHSGCRQYIEDIELARQAVGRDAPAIDKLRLFYNHPGFIAAAAARTTAALAEIPARRQAAARLVFTAHSIPAAAASRAPYEHQLREACRLTARSVESPAGTSEPAWDLVFQSRSGPPSQPWLEPDIRDHVRRLHADGVRDVVVSPIGFLAENLEVVYDLDVEARDLCDQLGMNMVRAATIGCHPRFVAMIRELVVERLDPRAPRLALGDDGPWPDVCPENCCRR